MDVVGEVLLEEGVYGTGGGVVVEVVVDEQAVGLELVVAGDGQDALGEVDLSFHPSPYHPY